MTQPSRMPETTFYLWEAWVQRMLTGSFDLDSKMSRLSQGEWKDAKEPNWASRYKFKSE